MLQADPPRGLRLEDTGRSADAGLGAGLPTRASSAIWGKGAPATVSGSTGGPGEAVRAATIEIASCQRCGTAMPSSWLFSSGVDLTTSA